jgi:SAM-dependent methyltransferase
MLLEEILVCPVCKGELSFEGMRDDGSVSCSGCQRFYKTSNGVFDFTPLPPPDQAVLSKWELWEQLQENGLFSYTAAPDLNLSVGERADAKAFGSFSDLSGLVLDIGCGPQDAPSYGTDFDGTLVGIDPLQGSLPKRFSFVQGIGEYLPFRSGVFDRVLFATSLDHVLDPMLTLAEARRVLKSEGTINIWFDSVEAVEDPSAETPDSRTKSRISRAVRMLRQGNLSGIMSRLAFHLRPNKLPSSMSYLSELEVPAGAVDHFHFAHITRSELDTWLEAAGLVITEASQFDLSGSCFARVKAARNSNPQSHENHARGHAGRNT